MLDIVSFMEQKAVVLTIVAVLILINMLQIFFIWKVRTKLPKFFIILMAIICLIILITSIYVFIHTLLFGYNS